MGGFFQPSFFEKYYLTKMLLTPIFHFFGLIRAWRGRILGKIRYKPVSIMKFLLSILCPSYRFFSKLLLVSDIISHDSISNCAIAGQIEMLRQKS
jgi:hypothetical protein